MEVWGQAIKAEPLSHSSTCSRRTCLDLREQRSPKRSCDYHSVYFPTTTLTMAEMNIPYVFAMKMEDRTVIKMVAIGATVVEKKDGIEFIAVSLLNPKILGVVMEDMVEEDIVPRRKMEAGGLGVSCRRESWG